MFKYWTLGTLNVCDNVHVHCDISTKIKSNNTFERNKNWVQSAYLIILLCDIRYKINCKLPSCLTNK